jgi:hypothetical protein
MKSKMDYSTPNTLAWQKVCDDLFLARYRGLPCEICGDTFGFEGKQRKRSMGHHLKEKDTCRQHRYNPANIVTLCPKHHGRKGAKISPHSTSTAAQARFYEWLRTSNPDKHAFLLDEDNEAIDGSLTYNQMYVILGGEVTDAKFKKDQRPLNHVRSVRIAEQDR